MMAKPALVVIAGATATGKSDTAIEAAKRIGGEIVSADSMQVYRGMDIGTGKVMPQEMQGVPHHLIDVFGPDDAYDLARYAADASEAIRGILGAGGVPVLAHPSYGSGDQLIFGEEMDARLKRLIGFGLQGVEAFYSGFTPRIRKEMLNFAEQYDLYITAGSDYHGRNKMIKLGDTGLAGIPCEEYPRGLKRFLERVLP